ncbi:MAG: hypothetical protein IJ667_04450 [Synergistaceae bacterium]|nr:hypothetical protein [Synergistaceae bacterium]
MIGPVNTGGGGDASAVAAEVGDLENLPTTDKSSIVAALIEINNAASNAASTASAAQRAANTNTSAIGALEDLQTTDKSSIVAAINEIAAGGGGGSSKTDPLFTLTGEDLTLVDASNYTLTIATKIGIPCTVTAGYIGAGVFAAASSDNSIVTTSVNNKTLTVTALQPGTCTIYCNLSETEEYSGASATIAVEVTSPGTLEQASWADIKAIGAAGTGANYWDVGDSKTITLNGTVGTLALNSFSCKVFILDFNYRGDNGVYFGGFKSTAGVDIALCDSKLNSTSTDGTKYFNMNHWGNVNYGGWKGCDLRYDILGSTDKAPSDYGKAHTTSCTGYDATSAAITNPVANTLMAALPADLRAALAAWTVYTDNYGNSSNVAANVTASIDYLPLLSEFEVQGARTYANQYEQNSQAQMAYYANGNSKIKYKHNDTVSACYWWVRSAYYTNDTNFCNVYTDGSAYYDGAYLSRGLVPAFKIS